MTALAWAIFLASLVLSDAVLSVKYGFKWNGSKQMATIFIFGLMILVLCTVRELIR